MHTMTKKKHPPNWVRHYRNMTGMTAEQLGDKVGMTKDGITLIERSERGLSIDMAKKIASALNCHYVDLYEGPNAAIAPRDSEEQKMLEQFRALPEADQKRILQTMEVWADTKIKADDPD